MVIVHVWLPDENHVGHTALTVDNVYVSFWPDGDAEKKDLKIKRSHPGAFMTDLQDDIRNEGNRIPISIKINNIDKHALLLYIKKIQREAPRYQIARNNCSHVVAECLFVACSKKPSFTPTAQEYGNTGRILGYGIWTPRQILRYARELTA
ncbi:MAG: hypothetical protein K6L75_11880 [Cellvibrionaceae bacterium]